VEQETREIEPHEEILEIVNLGEEVAEKHVKIGTSLTKEMQEWLYLLLREFKDVFAWSYQDMLGLNPDIVQHKLPLKLKYSLIKQKLRRMKPKMAMKIKEVEKQFNAGFLTVAKYPQWVENVVSVSKKDEKV